MNTQASKDQLVEEYSDYVVKIAKIVKRTLPNNIEIEDLIGYGMTGLIESARRFDSKHGVNFSTFSYYRIRGAIYDGLRAMGSLSRTEYKRQQAEERATAYMSEKVGHNSNSNLTTLAKNIERVACIYLTSMGENELNNIPDENSSSIEESVSKKQLYEKLKFALSMMSKTDKEIIRSYYFDDLSLEEVGKKLGISKSWTCRKHSKAIEKLSDLFWKLVSEKSRAVA